MIKNVRPFLLALPFLAVGVILHAQNGITSNKYKTNSEVQKTLTELQQKSPSRTTLHKIAESPGGEPIYVLEIGKELKNVPAIFVGANYEGKTPLSTEGALYLAKMLLDSANYTQKVKWMILPLPNPDATVGYFSSVKWERTANDAAVNDDKDNQLNEDGPDDLNGDGLITKIRVEDPEGTYIISGKDSRIMVRADPAKGERGKYKLYTEGLDNDGDGEINEDGPGGINVGINFPHLFKSNAKETGLWPGESPEAYGTMSFIFSHPEIAMVYTLGTSDFCMAPPRGGRKGGTNMESLKVPARFASRIGADPEKTYSMAEVVEMFKAGMPSRGGREMNAETVADFLGLGAAVNPLEDDLKFYTDFSDKYKAYLKAKGCSTDRIAADPDKDGSFELWAYYHLGVPSFSMNLFTPPKPAADQKPREAGAREAGTREMGARESTSRSSETDDAEKNILAYIDKQLKGTGFVKWQPFNHPTLGKVEIGGVAPFLTSTPPATQIDSLCKAQLPWLLQLSKKLPDIQLMKEVVTDLGAGVYKLELFVENKGILPYPTAMGAKNKQPAPVVVVLEGENLELLEGYMRTPMGDIGGNQVKKLTWTIKTDKKLIKAHIESPFFDATVKQIKIGG
ncbi:MAG: M14 family metallopeptidase [Prolixibacteraceae bacterium]